VKAVEAIQPSARLRLPLGTTIADQVMLPWRRAWENLVRTAAPSG